MTVLVIVIVVIGILAAALTVGLVLGAFAYQKVDLLSGEVVVASQPAYLAIDRKAHASRLGQLVVTNQRLLWKPSLFPFPRLEPQQIRAEEIVTVLLGEPLPLSDRPLVVEANGHRFEFFTSGTGAKLRNGDGSFDWLQFVSSLADNARQAR